MIAKAVIGQNQWRDLMKSQLVQASTLGRIMLSFNQDETMQVNTTTNVL